MTGIGGIKMWIEDFVINNSSYPKDYVKNFLKIKDLWNKCISEFKDCNSVEACNKTYENNERAIDDLRAEFNNYYGYNKLPVGIADSLDYFEEAVGELEDKALNKLYENSISVKVPSGLAETIKEVMSFKHIENEYKEDDIIFKVKGSGVYAEGNYWDVRSYLEDLYPDSLVRDLMARGKIIK